MAKGMKIDGAQTKPIRNKGEDKLAKGEAPGMQKSGRTVAPTNDESARNTITGKGPHGFKEYF